MPKNLSLGTRFKRLFSRGSKPSETDALAAGHIHLLRELDPAGVPGYLNGMLTALDAGRLEFDDACLAGDREGCARALHGLKNSLGSLGLLTQANRTEELRAAVLLGGGLGRGRDELVGMCDFAKAQVKAQPEFGR